MPHVDGVRHRDVQAAGIRFHVAEAGEGEPVVLLHGWPQHWYCWRKVVPLLAPERRVICPDMRGFGWSDAPPGRYDKQALTEDLFALLDALELERVDLVAHDWGAWVGFLACLDRPERIRRYLALNMYAPWPEPPSLRGVLGVLRLWYQVALSTPGLGPALIRRTDFVKRIISAGAVHPEAWTDADLEAFAAVLREPARASASVHLYRTFLLRELGPYAARRAPRPPPRRSHPPAPRHPRPGRGPSASRRLGALGRRHVRGAARRLRALHRRGAAAGGGPARPLALFSGRPRDQRPVAPPLRPASRPCRARPSRPRAAARTG